MTRLLIVVFICCLFNATEAHAHEVRPAYLELKQTSQDTFDVGWKVPARGENMRLGLYVRLPADCENTTEQTEIYVEGYRLAP